MTEDLKDETRAAREALLDVLASRLDEALPLASGSDRVERMADLVALCSQIGHLGEAAGRLHAWDHPG